jgi:hypothetical protein
MWLIKGKYIHVIIKKLLQNVRKKLIVIDVIEWEVVENVRLIDLTNKESPLVKYCSYSADTSSGLEYLVPKVKVLLD